MKLNERFMSFVAPEPSSGCWLWIGGTMNQDGYGKLIVGGAAISAHRLSYELFVGPTPKGFCVCHKCDTPSCVNPQHLFIGTHKENMQDAIKKGRLSIISQTGESNGRARFTQKEVEWIRANYVRRHPSLGSTALAKKFNVTQSVISRLTTRKTYKESL